MSTRSRNPLNYPLNLALVYGIRAAIYIYIYVVSILYCYKGNPSVGTLRAA